MGEASVHLAFPLSDEAYGSAEERDRLPAIEAALTEAVEAQGAGAWLGHEWGGGRFQISFTGEDPDRLLDALVRADVDGIPAGSEATRFRTVAEGEPGQTTPFPGARRKARKARRRTPTDPVENLADFLGLTREELGALPPTEVWRRFLAVGNANVVKMERALSIAGGLAGMDRAYALVFLAWVTSKKVDPASLDAALDAADAEAFGVAASANASKPESLFSFGRGLAARLFEVTGG